MPMYIISPERHFDPLWAVTERNRATDDYEIILRVAREQARKHHRPYYIHRHGEPNAKQPHGSWTLVIRLFPIGTERC